MADERANRKMSAILSADVKGYSRLMSEDEEGTVKSLNECRDIIARCVNDHRGRVVDSPGDNVLAEFVSTVEAVKCAVKIQEDIKARNAELPQSSRMEFRIGVNLGDVIEEDDRIYGDGVNIAARLEGLAEAGGICISGTAFDQVKGKLSLGYQFVGKQTVKNIPDPIRAYKVLMETEYAGKIIGEERSKKLPLAAVCAAVALVLFIGGFTIWNFFLKPSAPSSDITPEKPSIAVLPFNNMSNDPEQEYFSDGMTDDIITDLSKISGLTVISSNSTFTYKGKEIKIPVIAKELGVKYVLEGSIRRAGDEVRINAQLIDAVTDHHVWADRFDGKYESIFALQDKITERIVSALAVKLSASEQKVMAEKGTNNMVAYDTFLKAMSHMRKLTPKDLVKAIEYFENAIKLDPDYSEAYANLAYTYMSALKIGKKFWDESGKDFPTARLLARHNVEKAMKHPTSRGYQVMAILELYKRHFKEALDNAEIAVSISPNDADALNTLGRIMFCVGKPEETIKYHKRSIMLDPLHQTTDGIGFAYFAMGDYEQAAKYIEKAIKDYPENYAIRGYLAASYAFLGNDVKAKKAFKKFFT
jgi:TolB-like protein/class 3 adenylate cyclase